MNGFQWLVALRYLRMRESRSPRIHVITAVLLALVALSVAASWFIDHATQPWAIDFRIAHPMVLRLVKLAVIILFVLVEVFILLVRRLTIFTTISTYGLFLGSGALVIVLSVMSGFEGDLRHKILGTNAHIVITTPDKPFTDYDAIEAKIAKLPNVIGVTPYITNEVMIASQSNISGTILKGIDPATVGQVTDLQKNLDVGDLDYLAHPEKLKDLDIDSRAAVRFEETDSPDGKHDKETNADKRDKETNADKRDKETDEKPILPARPPRRVLPGVIIGRELAKSLRLYLGDDVNIVSPNGGIGPSGPIPKSKPFRVAGIFFSGMFEYDSKYAYLSIPAAQKFLGSEDEVTGLELKVIDPERTERTVAQVQKELGPGYEVQDWKQLNRNLFSALKLEKIAMFIVLCFIILVAAFSIIANGIMLVVEKGREIAILKSMGATDQSVLAIFLILGLYMGGLGTISGIAMGIVACLALAHFGISLDPDVYYITKLPVQMNAYEISAVFAAALGIALLATIYPAWIAARLRPVEGLHEAGH